MSKNHKRKRFTKSTKKIKTSYLAIGGIAVFFLGFFTSPRGGKESIYTTITNNHGNIMPAFIAYFCAYMIVITANLIINKYSK